MKTRSVTNRSGKRFLQRKVGTKYEAAYRKGHAVKIVLHGRAVSLGTATGRATVVTSRNDMVRIKKGSVIISSILSPEFGLVMRKACAIVTEYGGSQRADTLAFAGTYGIPAVAGVPKLMETIRNGDLVSVDGAKGIVEITKLNV